MRCISPIRHVVKWRPFWINWVLIFTLLFVCTVVLNYHSKHYNWMVVFYFLYYSFFTGPISAAILKKDLCRSSEAFAGLSPHLIFQTMIWTTPGENVMLLSLIFFFWICSYHGNKYIGIEQFLSHTYRLYLYI